MDTREIKALEIAARMRVVQRGKLWLVPSQSGPGTYGVDLSVPSCACEDYATGGPGHVCKHILAARIVAARELNERYGIREQPAPPSAEPMANPRPSYKQDWVNYDLAQTNEKRHLQEMLAELCSTIPEPTPKGRGKGGRPTVPLRDQAFATVFKVYCGMSSRRFVCDLQDAAERGHMLKAVGYSAVAKAMESEALTPILQNLIRQSAAPLAEVECDFAVDSSGFCTNRYTRWFDVKYGTPQAEQDWVKAHICTGVKTNCVTAVEIYDKHAGDCNVLPTLTDTTARNFTIREMSADKAYTCNQNFEAVAKHGGTLYAAFKVNTTGGVGGLFEKMWHLFCLNREDYLKHYHRRSNVESTFSAVKRKFGEGVRSKTDVAQKNEVLCKFVCQNICCLIHAAYELGLPILPSNRGEGDGPAVLKFPGVA